MKRKRTHIDEVKPAPAAKRSSSRKKYDVIGILMLVGALLLFLAMISYSHEDEAVADIGLLDFFRLFGGDPEIQARADITSNWLGLFGALVAKFFIRSTVGYFSLAIPFLVTWWGWIILREKDPRVGAYYTNYVLLLSFLSATFLGLLRLLSWFPHPAAEWAGSIGDFTAGLLARFIGTVGGLALIFTAILIIAVVVIDFDIHRTLDRLGAFGQYIRARFRRDARESDAEALDLDDEEIQTVSLKSKPTRRSEKNELQDVVIRKQEVEAPVQTNASKKKTEERPAKTTFSISRARESAADATLRGPLRSNGVIPLSALTEPDYIVPDEAASPQVRGESAKAKPHAIEDAEEPPVDAEPPAPRKQIRVQESESLAPPPKLSAELFSSVDEANLHISSEAVKYMPPPFDLLHVPIEIDSVSDDELQAKAELVKDKLAMFDIAIDNISVTPGPVVTLYELVPDSGVKISKIVSLADDLALALAAKGIRIIAPIPGKSAVGIEIPNDKSSLVNARSVINTAKYKDSKLILTLALGKTITGDVFVDDLAKMPHLLVAGSTGSGKSVGINVMLASILYKMHPSDVKLVLIDPKKIELAQYRPLRNHFLAVCPDINEDIITTPANSVIALKSLELEMEKRYDRLAKAGVRHISDYNAKVRAHTLKDTDAMKHYKLPYIIVVVDELADLMITAAREVEEPIARLAQLARAVGIHLILATQRPSVDVITGVIKANFSARIAYQVATRVDSRTILDMNGAEQLLGNGDMLYQPSGSPKPVRIQNAFIATDEVEKIVEHISAQKGFAQPYRLPSVLEKKKAASAFGSGTTDDLFDEAARLIVRHQQGSVSLLQRRLKVGYSRAARIVDELEMAGIVGPYDGSKAREVLVETEEELEEILRST